MCRIGSIISTMLVCDATPVLAQTASTALVLNVSKGSANAYPARPIRLIIPLPHVPRCQVFHYRT